MSRIAPDSVRIGKQLRSPPTPDDSLGLRRAHFKTDSNSVASRRSPNARCSLGVAAVPRPRDQRLIERDERALSPRRERVKDDQGRRTASGRHNSSPPSCERVWRIRTDRTKRLCSESQHVEYLATPESCDHVCLARPRAHPEPLAKRTGEICTLGVEGTGHRLKVGKSRAVLDVEERPPRDIPGNDVGPARELVVLIGLVDPRRDAELTESSDFVLAQRRMYAVNDKVRRQLTSFARVDQRHFDPSPKGVGHAGGTLCGSRSTGFNQVHERRREPGAARHLGNGPTSSQPRVAHLLAEEHPQPIHGRHDGQRRFAELLSRRHPDQI